MDARWARLWYGVTALAVLVGLVIQIPVAAVNDQGFFTSQPERALNVFCFFTVQANIIVGVTCLLLALRPDRSSTVFRVLRLTGIVSITITGIVYHVALAHLFDLDSWALVADTILHTIVPVAAVIAWLAFGPRGLTDRRIVVLSIVFPVAWLAFTLIREPLASDFSPYPFVDVKALGYGRVIVNCVWVAVLYLGVSAGANAIDRRLPGAAPRAQMSALPR